jgi:glycosyltransferase involved in cell wall biosynthesis
MKLLVFAHRLELGGTQTNAIELAAALRDLHGFEILFHATPGAMKPLLEQKGLRFLPAPDARFHPSYSRMRVLHEIVQKEKPDLIHAWDWWQALEVYFGAYLPLKVPLLISDMMMNLTRVLPRAVPTTFGFRGLQEEATRKGWQKALLLPPPVDVKTNTPELPYNTTALERLGLKPQNIALVTVSRLSHVMKSESIFQTIHAVRNIGNDVPVQFVIVGDGAARHEIEESAQAVNTALGRNAIILTGALTDPRPAYAAADIVIGMGGAALRGMAFGKPVIVTGEKGFARAFCSRTVDTFETTGLYGVGNGDGETFHLEEMLRRLSRDALLRGVAGAFGQDYVTKNHSLEKLSGDLAGYCREAVTATRAMPLADVTRASYYYMRDRRFKTASRDRTPDESSRCDTPRAVSRKAASHSNSTERT